MANYDPNFIIDEQRRAACTAAANALQTGIPFVKQGDHKTWTFNGASRTETCAEVIARAVSTPSIATYRGQEALKHMGAAVLALRGGSLANIGKNDHSSANEPCVMTLARKGGFPI